MAIKEKREKQRLNRTAQSVSRITLQLATSETARVINREIILQLIRSHQPISRADLSRLSGLQRSTVSQIAEQLIEERWIREGAMGKLPRGRRPTPLLLNDELASLVVDIHPGHAVVAIVDLNGRLLTRTHVPLTRKPAQSIASILKCMNRMRTESRGRPLEGIGISLPGRVDPDTKQLIFAPNLSWAPFDIRGTIEREMGLVTEMENAANSCLMAELWYGHLRGVRNAVLITISEGIGAGIMMNGQLITGCQGLAGEFGHIPLDPTGHLCSCGQKGCWEALASLNAALRYYKEVTTRSQPDSYHELLNRADEGDKHAIKALDRQAAYIGSGLRMVMSALSPEVILIAGEVTWAWQRFAPLLEAELVRTPLTKKLPRLLAVHDGDLARLRGAAAVFLQRHLVHAHGA